MSGAPGTHNNVTGGVGAPVVQANSIGGVTFHLPVPAPLVPHQLPAVVPRFVGRDEKIAQLDASLNGSDAPTSLIHVISGTAGVGKTTLAVRWAHQVSEKFPDGQLYVNLRGFDPTGAPVAPAEAVREFLDAFGVPSERIPVALDAQAAMYRSLLAERRVLVVLDNAHDAKQVRPLLPGAGTCLVLVTSRDRLQSLIVLEGAQPVGLTAMTNGEAKELLASRLGAARVAKAPQVTQELIDRCVRLPLALVIVAARALVNPDFPIEALVEELRHERDRLDLLDAGDGYLGVRAVFSWSYRSLSPEAAGLFRLLGLHLGPTISLAAAAALAGLSVRDVRPLLAELAKAHLIEEAQPRRYGFHDLLRSYAAELVGGEESEPWRLGAVRRMLEFYLHTALAADHRLAPHRARITVPEPPAGLPLTAIADERQALDWFVTEHATLLGAINTARHHSVDAYAWRLAWSFSTYLERKGHWRDWMSTQRTAVSAAMCLGEVSAQARAHLLASRAAIRLAQLDDAAAHLQQALSLYEEFDNSLGLARTHISFSWVRELQQRFPEAIEHAARSLELFRSVGNRAGEARALDQLGWEQALSGDCEQGLVNCERALELLIELGHRPGQADCEDSLGYINHQLGRYDRAVRHLQRSIALCQELGDPYTGAVARDRLGDTYLALGREREACETWQVALTTLEQMLAPEEPAVRAKLEKFLRGKESPAGDGAQRV
ncbi:MAG TPA: tetratricopeptide repeat protein [Amycolatopsis sp.]|uniref:ATP-binding protein n=1 Tax=Amycolatopsis sp. TaxID=37632 RepID=UPI002B486F86|nr:tetratricopeptide repeat protein [Amycolatopsis sp.]HKS47815.1 tetratricopeptide repeat protein [Amycolatopsis sp.]